MKVKKFVAKSMSEAMKQIRSELGSEAVILNSKEIETGGFLGFFTKKNIEVIAAVDSVPTVRRSIPKKKPPQDHIKPKEQSTPVAIKTETKDEGLEKEVKELKSLVNNMTSSFATQFHDYPESLKKINQTLIDQDISSNIRIEVMKKLLKNWYVIDKETTSENETLQWAKNILKETIQDYEMGGFTFNKKFLNLVGPTGVGKTTTIAKIAAHCMLKHKKKVAFITTDTFRIAAIDQLKTYAKILNVPIEVAFSVEDFVKAKEKLAEYDVVLVDSAGRNFLNQMYIDELKKVIDFDEEMETYLVLSLTSKYRDMASIYEQFSKINISKVIFSKKDETLSRGAMLNFVHDFKLGVAYITNGQSVPDDILEGSLEELVNSIFEAETYE